jgi:hypothetical protein
MQPPKTASCWVRRGRSSPANASGLEPHHASITSRFGQAGARAGAVRVGGAEGAARRGVRPGAAAAAAFVCAAALAEIHLGRV